MYRKSFVSLYILPELLTLVELSPDHKSIKRSIQVDLPKGLIKDYKVADQNSFAKAVSSLWTKYNLKNKAVAIILPEFAAYTKLLTLPKVPTSELSEAVLWAAQEYIPQDINDMLIDWKITEQKETTTDIFLVAMKQDVVLSYAETIEKAGLSPLFVEIPSLSIVRLGGDIKTASLFIYGHEKESVVVVAKNNSVLGSSVVHGNDTKELASTIKKILTHFKTEDISQVFTVGKLDSLEGLLPEDSTLSVKPITLPFKKITPEIAKTFVVPLSLAGTDITEPSDPFTINLLPQKYVSQYNTKKVKKQARTLLFTVTVFVLFILSALLLTYMYLTQAMNSEKSASVQNTSITQRRTDAVALVKNLNKVSDKVLAVKKLYINPQEVIGIVENAKPDSVAITNYKIDFDLGEVRVSGIAQNRSALIEFKQELEKSEAIDTVDIPISNFETETDLEYQISFSYIPIAKTITK